MLSTQTILEDASRDGSLDIAEWPRVLEGLLQKLHDIVHNDFPLPSIPLPALLPPTIDPEVVASTPPQVPNSDPEPSAEDLPDASENEAPPNSQSSSKENDEPTDIAASRPPVPGFEVNHTHQPVQPPDSIETEPGTLPPELLSLYQSSTRILEHDFSQSPPYTIQRLAELVLHPKRHYRFLPAYLRALDRIVSVSSPISDFPLPTLQAAVNGGFLTNGDSSQVNGVAEREGLGSDESLGGALLTPIPWLRTNNTALTGSTTANGNGHDGELHSESTETIEGPNGAGSIETVSVTVNGVSSASSVANTSPTPASPTLSEQSDASSSSSAESTEAQLRQQGGVTQGELLRQEQEAGVVPVSQPSPRRSLISGGAAAVGREPAMNNVPRDTAADVTMEDSRPPEETPHARGPELIGMEDMGPQHHPLGAGSGLDMEAAVGRSKSPPAEQPPQPAQVGSPGSPPPVTTQEQKDEVPTAVVAEVEAAAAEEDDAGAPGKDPQDVEKEVEKLKEGMDEV
ncbi:hypothetical protein LTR85_005462 [Meristemomyces frigidus]|nr:hypothetical protein LTR85_005462 [Meristemomyces frigidus]